MQLMHPRAAQSRPTPNGSGFTLIELLVVIAIIAVLIGLLAPGLAGARKASLTTVCLSNLHQMTVAASAYAGDNADFYPVAYWNGQCWDLNSVNNQVVPGLLWANQGTTKVQQCPAFTGAANWYNNPYTGYNYNTSFIGHGQYETTPTPVTICQVYTPSRTVIFGDGQYASGADKFMRAPFPSPGDQSSGLRCAGTQGYRHQGRTNAAHCDGHAESIRDSFTNNADGADVAPGTGFLSPDNSVYDNH
jgi:prepilin-type N-terminal cleavage/methylation domain-containing protein/prepilin-type processing-associated H-X9-DG protein